MPAGKASRQWRVHKRLVVRTATERVEAAEMETEQVLNNALEMSGPEEADEGNLAEAEAAMKANQGALVQEKELLDEALNSARSSSFDGNSIAELTKLQPRIQTLQQSLAVELQQVQKMLVDKACQRSAMRKQAAAEVMELFIEAEQQAARNFQTVYPQVVERVTTAINAVESLATLTARMVLSTEISAADRHAIQIEKTNACQELGKARRILSDQIVDMGCSAPAARGAALQEYEELSELLCVATKRLPLLEDSWEEIEQAAAPAMQEIMQK